MPEIFAEPMSELVELYMQRCESLGATPDHGLLDPVLAALARLQAEQDKPP
jgi:hypothetical protein